MRDRRFITVKRGGLLTEENHHLMIKWAIECSEHVLYLIDDEIDTRLTQALSIAREWEKGNKPTGFAMKAAASAHAAARDYTDPFSVAVARSIGHAVATAHMSDHSVGAALYARKAIKLAGKSLNDEIEWQNRLLQLLPSDIVMLIRTTIREKEKSII